MSGHMRRWDAACDEFASLHNGWWWRRQGCYVLSNRSSAPKSRGTTATGITACARPNQNTNSSRCSTYNRNHARCFARAFSIWFYRRQEHWVGNVFFPVDYTFLEPAEQQPRPAAPCDSTCDSAFRTATRRRHRNRPRDVWRASRHGAQDERRVKVRFKSRKGPR